MRFSKKQKKVYPHAKTFSTFHQPFYKRLFFGVGVNFKKGFSIGEVVLSTFILAFTMVVILRVIAVSLRDSMDSRDSIIASALAQEGVELVRSLRDNNWIYLGTGATSFTGFPSASSDVLANCKIDKTAASPADITCDGSSKTLNYSTSGSTNGFYVRNDSAGDATKFQRKISLAYDTGNPNTANKLTVRSTVIWSRSSSDFPVSCTIGNKCIFTEIVLNKWNE